VIDTTFLTKLEMLAVAANRQTIITPDHRTFLYRPDLDRYEELERVVKQTGKVANVACLEALVLEEARRRLNVDGEFMTVCFTEGGAFFSPDDRERLDGYTYERVLAPEWKTIRDFNGKVMKHQEFLRLLQSLRWCLQAAGPVIRSFRSVDVSRVARIASAPTMVDGKAGVTLAVEIAAKVQGGGEAQASQSLPGELVFSVPYARGDQVPQTLEAEVVIEMARDGEKDVVLFGFIVPDIHAVERNAKTAEVAFFREGLKALPRVLVLENF
jgi:hypothetical protein